MEIRIHKFFSILMRVPPIFVIDTLLKVGLGTSNEPLVYNSTDDGFQLVDSQNDFFETVATAGNSVFSNQVLSGSQITNDLNYGPLNFILDLKSIGCFLGCIAAFCIFLLWTRHLLIVYIYLASLACLFLSYTCNSFTMNAVISYMEADNTGIGLFALLTNLQLSDLWNGPGWLIFANYFFQIALAVVFYGLYNGPKHPMLQYFIIFCFSVPSYFVVYPVPASFMLKAPPVAAFFPLAINIFWLCYNAFEIWRTIYRGYDLLRNFVSNYGLSALFETQWARLHVPSVLRTFWLLRVSWQIARILFSEYEHEDFNYYDMIKTLMVNGCETVTAVLGMTSVISVICHYIGDFFQWVLLNEEEDEKSIGTISAILFYILALQTGLTSLDTENRLQRLCRNLCLLFTAVLHFVHNIVNPLMMSLSASHNPALHRHLRALAVCTFLIVFPVWLLSFLWSQYPMTTWLLAVSVFSIEVVVKVIVSLAIYSLFLYDAYRKNFWDELDDWVYIIKSFGNTIEFAFGIILFFNGFWILVFEAGGTIRAIMMCVHAYFNLWCEAKAGWTTFMKRRQAVNKINSLPSATRQQLIDLNDVCAICYQDMESAKITCCNHYFHSICLRKWLYVQDRCPLCHDIMYKVNNSQNEPAAAEEPVENGHRMNVNNEDD
ncbi:protein TRC8 homolog [Trichogramma pretiosum]|uniref:protein TRC8 homolog n=1 Tax=Trichogramma pretiosum TaxID=7493 RepID=UPI0006C98A95|nr:protein TRC8 homolog [Trichogramma pretiosum]